MLPVIPYVTLAQLRSLLQPVLRSKLSDRNQLDGARFAACTTADVANAGLSCVGAIVCCTWLARQPYSEDRKGHELSPSLRER